EGRIAPLQVGDHRIDGRGVARRLAEEMAYLRRAPRRRLRLRRVAQRGEALAREEPQNEGQGEVLLARVDPAGAQESRQVGRGRVGRVELRHRGDDGEHTRGSVGQHRCTIIAPMLAPKPRKTVVWFDDGKRPNVADLLEKEPGIVFHRLFYDAPEADNWKALSSAHVYCISSTRQEMPAEYRCDARLLARCPDLLVVSTSGAGYDTVDARACTEAGVLVVNQSGANADAVAEHALAMLLSLSKNIPQTDRTLRSPKRLSREHFKGWNAHGRTIGLVGIGNTGRRLARMCALGLQMKVLACDPYLSAEEIRERGATKVDLAT